jgi:hypothetical protein
MFSWFKKFFNKSKKSNCCSKNTCATPSVWNKPQDLDDAGEYVANTMVINTIANSICMDQGHPMCCSSEDSISESCCAESVADSPMPDCSPSCCDTDCSSTDCSSSCCGDSGCCGD